MPDDSAEMQQVASAPEVDDFSAPILSADGLNCCIEKILVKAMRN